MTLEFNQFKVITAENGKDALKLLLEISKIPNLIISDIMMPEMDGYEFFKKVSEDSKLCYIPFVFLTALDSPEDKRLGKLLGADDYLTKPIDVDDLLATITGKIKRSKNIDLICEKLNQFFESHKTELVPSISESEREKILLLEVVWDDIIGPNVIKYHPEEKESSFSIKKVGVQLFDAANSIYGQGGFKICEGILVNLRNLNLMSYAFFDSYPDEKFRGGEKQFMVAVISPKITYFHSLKLKDVFIEISEYIKQRVDWDIEEYWENISKELVRPPA